MRPQWLYLCWAFGLIFAGQGMSIAISSPLPLLVGLSGGILCSLVAIFHATDLDPTLVRVVVSGEEAVTATERLRWVDKTVTELASRAQIKPLRTTKFANAGIYYKPLWHRVNISPALCARLSDADLRLILAHEMGHAARRYSMWSTFRESSRIAEELRADEMALRLTGASEDDWMHAMLAALCAEGHSGRSHEISARLAALGVDSAVVGSRPC